MGDNNGSKPPGTLDISTLSSHLWESANILRGPMDAADFKTYIFPAFLQAGVRQKLLEMDLLDAVIGLGANLFYGTGISAACVLVFRVAKPKEVLKR